MRETERDRERDREREGGESKIYKEGWREDRARERERVYLNTHQSI